MMDPPYTGPKMEARRTSATTVVTVPRDLDLDKEARVYGSRWTRVESAEGAASFQEVPLTWADLFDPRDHVPHGPIHAKVISETKESLVPFFTSRGRDDIVVYDDVKMFWKDPLIPTVAPDIAVIPGMKEPDPKRESFNEREEETRPCFVLEVISKATADFDRNEKLKIYRRAKVRECFMLDRLKSPWELVARRLNPKTGKYRKVAADQRGQYLAETIGVYFSISESGDELILEDAETGEVIMKPIEQAEARRREAEAREAAERRAAGAEGKIQELLAEIERLKSSDD